MEVRPLVDLNGNRTFVCTHCGTWFKTNKYNEHNESQCPFCGEWAVHISSPEAEVFEFLYFELGKYSTDVDEILKNVHKVMEVIE